MSNVINADFDAVEKQILAELSEHFTFPQESEIYFPVYEAPLFFQGNDGQYKVDSHKSIVRMWNNEPKSIGIVSSKYRVAPTKAICQSIEEIFKEQMTNDELLGCTIRDQVAHYGSKTIRQYIFPNINKQISDKSNVGFRVVIVNGYDGSSSFKLHSGAIDFFCTNGMVTGSFDLTVRRHTSGFSIPQLTDRVRKNIDIFYKQADIWSQWVHRTITPEQAKECFEAIPNISERRVEQLMRQYLIEMQSHGPTVWALYSAATFYATHSEGEFKIRQTESNHQPITLLNREQQIRSWVSSDDFAALVA